MFHKTSPTTNEYNIEMRIQKKQQLGANAFGLLSLLIINGIFHGNHMGTVMFFLAAMVFSMVLLIPSKEASLEARRLA